MKIVKIIIATGALFLFVFTAHSQTGGEQNNNSIMKNPLLQKSVLQYQAPQFDLIKDEHFKPAFEYGLKVHDKEIDAITNNDAQPTFHNTIIVLFTTSL